MPSPKHLLRRLLGIDRDDRPARAPMTLIAMPVPSTPEPTPGSPLGASLAHPATARGAPIIILLPGRSEPQIVRDSTPLLSLTAEQHSETFLDWLQDVSPVAPSVARACGATGAVAGLTGDDILVCDLEEMHREMCLDLGVAPMRWALVSKHFRALVGERKRYVWHRETPAADKVRLCVMSVPARVPWAELPHAEAA